MDKASTSSLRLARTLVRSMASPALRPASLFSSSAASSSSSTTATTALRRPIRLFSSTAAVRDDSPRPPLKPTLTPPSTRPPRPSSASLMEGLADLLPNSSSSGSGPGPASSSPPRLASYSSGFDDFSLMQKETEQQMEGNYHFAVYAHKHNTHVTVSKPDGKVILSLSCGNLGFRKSNRKSYDAAYQLGAYACDKLYQGNWHKKITNMRVTLRGFGAGREALTKILLGTEGRPLRDKITQVADTTRLKFGGHRSPRIRRLG